jgi:hypothetical protein
VRHLSILLVSLVGCGHNSGTTPPDAASDIASADADPSCLQWRLVSVPLTDVHSLEATPINPERSARFFVDVSQCPGDLPARPTYGFTLENEYVALTMNVWRHLPDCTTTETVQRPVTIRFLYAATWRFILTNGDTRNAVVAPAPGTACNTAASTCDQDCDCDSGVCLSAEGFGGPIAHCARPCELDRDCGGDGTCGSAADDLTDVCQPGGLECTASKLCPEGFTCNTGRCEPTFTLGSATRHACTCDSECDTGMHCAFHSGSTTGSCEALCRTESSNWCQGPHVCGAGSVEPDYGVCGWVGE